MTERRPASDLPVRMRLRLAGALVSAAVLSCASQQPSARTLDSAPRESSAARENAAAARQDAANADDRSYVPPARPAVLDQELSTRELFVAYCSACHSLELAESQRLDRANWEWVMSDMVNDYGGAWISDAEQKVLIDYLVENYGPPAR